MIDLGFGRAFLLMAALGGALACNSFDEPSVDGPKLFIPTDDRPAIHSEVRPKAVSGGTLLVTDDGRVIVSDEDRDQIHVVTLSPALALEHTITLSPDDRPGRAARGAGGLVHVVLRGAGSVVTIDPSTGEISGEMEVCRAPRGLGFDEASGLLHVACAEGRLVTMDPSIGTAVRDVALDADLRDVIVRDGEIWVTRFKSAELLRVDAAGDVAGRTRMPEATVSFQEPAQAEDTRGGDPAPIGTVSRLVPMSATVAWRAVETANGAVVVHQEAADEEVELTEPSPSGSAYGGGGDMFGGCGGIVRTAVSVVDAGGNVTKRQIVAGTVVPVDVAVSPSGRIAIASAGTRDFEAPRPQIVFPGEEGAVGDLASPAAFGGSVAFLNTSNLADADSVDPCGFTEMGVPIEEPAVAVAFAGEELLVQTREPARLWHVSSFGEATQIQLSTESRLDTGHEIFHRDSGGGIACASCHPEGGEDGHVWRFSGVGERRTQALHVGLEGTQPFHWDGDLGSVGALLDEVFVNRMGGVKQSSSRLGVLSDWLFAMERPAPMRDATDPAVVRGAELFSDEEIGCAGCHSGESFTDNESHAVGTLDDGARLQVPSLVAIGYRTPFMHDGCAQTLVDRFDPACGGESHGNTAALSADQIGDLVAYLESL